MSQVSLCERLRVLDKYLVRNPDTGALSFDVERVADSAELRCLLAEIWDSGYWSGFDNGVADSYVDEQAVNPFR